MARIAPHTRVAAYVSAFFTQRTVRVYARPVALASVLWASYCWFRDGELDGTGIALYVGTAALVVVRWLAFHETRKLTARYHDAFDRGDADELAALSQLFRLFHDEDERATHMRMRLGEEMIVRKRWLEAHQALAGVNLGIFPRSSRAVILNNLAYVTARMGDPNAALEIVQKAHAEADKAPKEKMAPVMPSLRGTHGIALTLAGRHDEALPLLESAANAGSTRSRNERTYWLGCVYRALGRIDEARASFARAIEMGGPCTDEARVALAAMSSPFRT
jgi:tetratricopeptide (TPR) repeat protein